MTTDWWTLTPEQEHRRELAEKNGWTGVTMAYDDNYGGLYLGGVAPNGEWEHVPEIKELE